MIMWMRLPVIAIVMAVMAGEGLSWAGEPQAAAGAKRQVGTQIPPLTYHPPKLGAPRGRVGGGARGAESGMVSLAVLAPDHPAQTIESRPTLYWYASQETNSPVEFTLMADDQIRPLLEKRLADSVRPGIHKINPSDLGAELSLSTTYRWYVTIISDRERRSRDIIAGGVIERVSAPDGLADRLRAARTEEKPKLFAEAGIWYDAIAALSSLIEASPDDDTLRTQRAMLLDQVGLFDVAEFDRKLLVGDASRPASP